MYWTFAFYGFLLLVEAAVLIFIGNFWRRANSQENWRWTSEDSRDMYTRAAETIITASGIAVALLASLSLSSEKHVNALVEFSAKVAAVSLIFCVCVSLALILALARGHEQAKSRHIAEIRKRVPQGEIETDEGSLSNFELRIILVLAGSALSSFFVGFLFLGRIVFHL